MAETAQLVGLVRLKLLPLLLLWLCVKVSMVCSSFGDTTTSFVVLSSALREESCRSGRSLNFVAVSRAATTRGPHPSLSQHQPRHRNKSMLKPLCLATAAPVVPPPHIPILLETERFLVIDKPAGVPHHSDPPDNNSNNNNNNINASSVGILQLLRAQRASDRRDSTSRSSSIAVAETEERLYGVHRLDRVTSGILLVAKDAVAAAAACRAFREGRVTKYYTGLSCHQPHKKKQGWIQGDMVRGRRKSWYLTSSTSKDTSNNTTNELKNFAKTRFFSAGLGHMSQRSINADGAAVQQAAATTKTTTTLAIRTLLVFRPYTGQTHQLRVAAKSVGLPLAGDPIYKDSNKMASCTRTYLHATGLHIPASALSADESMNHGDLTIWCPPPFESSAWEDNLEAQAGFRQALQTLVEKHCDCPPLLELATSAHLNSLGHQHEHQQHDEH